MGLRLSVGIDPSKNRKKDERDNREDRFDRIYLDEIQDAHPNLTARQLNEIREEFIRTGQIPENIETGETIGSHLPMRPPHARDISSRTPGETPGETPTPQRQPELQALRLGAPPKKRGLFDPDSGQIDVLSDMFDERQMGQILIKQSTKKSAVPTKAERDYFRDMAIVVNALNDGELAGSQYDDPPTVIQTHADAMRVISRYGFNNAYDMSNPKLQAALRRYKIEETPIEPTPTKDIAPTIGAPKKAAHFGVATTAPGAWPGAPAGITPSVVSGSPPTPMLERPHVSTSLRPILPGETAGPGSVPSRPVPRQGRSPDGIEQKTGEPYYLVQTVDQLQDRSIPAGSLVFVEELKKFKRVRDVDQDF